MNKKRAIVTFIHLDDIDYPDVKSISEQYINNPTMLDWLIKTFKEDPKFKDKTNDEVLEIFNTYTLLSID